MNKNLTDFSSMPAKKFWDLVAKDGAKAQQTVETLFEKAAQHLTTLTQEEAVECLDSLFIYSHYRIKEHSNVLTKFYPTKQLTKNRLKNLESLWWVDHFTAGISKWSTLSWFSSNKTKIGKDGKKKYNGASTHFIQGYHGYPFYIIPLMHGAWHEPKRNKDSYSIEYVNAGGLKMHEGRWCYWPRKWTSPLPVELVSELNPVRLVKPYKEHTAMQPFTKEQLINSIILKRLIDKAMPEKLDRSRMSQHSDWRASKSDMGPLWPLEDVNDSAFDNLPVDTYAFIQNYQGEAIEGEKAADTKDETSHDNPEYGNDTPTHDDDPITEEDIHLSTGEVQEKLVKIGIRVAVDNKFGPKTKDGIKEFQRRWNIAHSTDQLKVDGIAGPETCKRLIKESE